MAQDKAICGIGVDIEDVARFTKVARNTPFLKKVFTDREIRYCRRFSSPEPHLAARFAGKEAVLKAFGAIDEKPSFNEIEILNRKDGMPLVNLKDVLLKKRFLCLISLSHSKTRVVAFSVIRKKEPR